MLLQTFFDNFALLADAPNGIAQLRELILDLAIRGHIVPQYSSDEPASILLERIKKGQVKARRNKQKDSAPLFSVEDIEPPFELPSSWTWVRLSDVGHEWGQKKPDVTFTYIDVAAIDNRRGIITDEIKLLKPDEAPSRARKIVKKGTVVYSTVRPYLLNIAIVEKDYSPEPIASTAFAVIHPLEGISAKYLFYYLRSRTFIDFVEKQMQGVAYPAINDEKLFMALVPLPPAEEQLRIVTKVDELIRLCDELEARQQARRKSRVRLNNATLAPLNNAAALASEEFEQASARLADNFAKLYDSAETIGKFRSTILQLAVQGKLVRQDPRDEPARVLLEKITREKLRLSKEKKFRQTEPLFPVKKSEFPFQLPTGWEWAKFGDVTINRDGERVPLEKSVRQARQGIYDYYGASGVIDKLDDYLFDKPLLLIGEDGANLINRATPIAFIAKGKYWVNNHAHVLDSLNLACLEYLEVFINAIDLRPYITGTAQPKMNQAKMNSILVAVAPEAEQKRIVAKVNQLMALCDELEAKLRQTEADSERLMKAAVQHVLVAINESSQKESYSAMG